MKTILTVQVAVSQEELLNIEKFELMLIKKRPGLCWETAHEPDYDENLDEDLDRFCERNNEN